MPLPFEDLERVYDQLAVAIDEIGPERESLFLCKLALTLANHAQSFEEFDQALTVAKRDLDPAPE